MKNWQKQEQRISDVVGDPEGSRDQGLQRWYRHLDSVLVLPFEVTGLEDFQWEEFYVLGGGDGEEYEALRTEQPSYQDVFDLMAIDAEADSEWSMFHDDLKAHVRRKVDGKRFVLGLSELKAVDKGSRHRQVLDDYSVWFVNSR